MKKWIKFLIPCAAAAVALSVWGVSFARANDLKYKPVTEIYETGEVVDIGKNYFDSVQENVDGYTIRVNGAVIRDYKTYIESLGGEIDYEEYAEMGVAPPKYVYDVEVTMTNSDNTEGRINLNWYELQDMSLTLPIDFTLWNLLAPQIAGSSVFTLKQNSEAVIHFPFVEQPMNGMVDEDATNKMIENDTFYLCVSHYPVRKLIRIDNVTLETP